MRSVVVNGGRAFEVPVQLQSHLAEIVSDTGTTPQQKHEKICTTLRIGRFVPAPQHKPYALRAVNLQIYDASRCTHSFGGWFECFHCHTNVDMKPSGQACHTCGKNALPNFKDETPKPKKRY